MAVNLSKNGVRLSAAYRDVVDWRCDTNWALFTYEGDSSDIRLAGKGAGGLEEMVEELSSGKVMYAFCCVNDPNSGLPKYVLINWTGECVKDSRKGVYANHVSSIAAFLKGAHVTINARAEEDVAPPLIRAKVAQAAGVNFNFSRRSGEHGPAARGSARDEKKREEEEEERERVEADRRQREEQEERDKEKRSQNTWTRGFQKTLKTENENTQVPGFKEMNGRAELRPARSLWAQTPVPGFKNGQDELRTTRSFWAQTQKEAQDIKESSKRVEEERRRVEEEKRKAEESRAKDGDTGGNQNKRAKIIQNRSFQQILEIEKREMEQQKKQASVHKKLGSRGDVQRTVRESFWAQSQKLEEQRRKDSSKEEERRREEEERRRVEKEERRRAEEERQREQEERQRLEEERRRLEEERQRAEREKRQLEERQAKEREKRDKDNRTQIIQNSFQKKPEIGKQQMTKDQTRQTSPSQSTGTRVAESVQKANEARLLISQRSSNPRDVFKQHQPRSPGPSSPAPGPQPGKLRSPFLTKSSGGGGGATPPGARRLSPPAVRHAPRSPSTSTSPPPGGHGENGAAPHGSDHPEEAPPSRLYENDMYSEPLGYASSDEWSDEFDDDDEDETEDDVDGDDGTKDPVYETLYEDYPPDDGLKARALYGYQAVDQTEITFDPGDLITRVEMADQGWWRGCAPSGHRGLFPASYVELLQ